MEICPFATGFLLSHNRAWSGRFHTGPAGPSSMRNTRTVSFLPFFFSRLHSRPPHQSFFPLPLGGRAFLMREAFSSAAPACFFNPTHRRRLFEPVPFSRYGSVRDGGLPSPPGPRLRPLRTSAIDAPSGSTPSGSWAFFFRFTIRFSLFFCFFFFCSRDAIRLCPFFAPAVPRTSFCPPSSTWCPPDSEEEAHQAVPLSRTKMGPLPTFFSRTILSGCGKKTLPDFPLRAPINGGTPSPPETE